MANNPIFLLIGVFGSYVYCGVSEDPEPFLPGTHREDITRLRVFNRGQPSDLYERRHGLCRASDVRDTAQDLEQHLLEGHPLILDEYCFADETEALDCISHMISCAERAEADEEAFAIRYLMEGPGADPWADAPDGSVGAVPQTGVPEADH